MSIRSFISIPNDFSQRHTKNVGAVEFCHAIEKTSLSLSAAQWLLLAGETRRCFDDCGMDQCESTKCVHECHKRCMKKTKETRQIITQYETTCGSDDCSEKPEREELPTTNVTTNIDINNVIHNHMPQKPAEGPSSPGSNQPGSNTPGSNPPGQNPSGPNAPGPGGFPNWPCGSGPFGCDTSLSLVPQIQFVPQITFGLGIQQSAPSSWLTQQVRVTIFFPKSFPADRKLYSIPQIGTTIDLEETISNLWEKWLRSRPDVLQTKVIGQMSRSILSDDFLFFLLPRLVVLMRYLR